MRVALLATGLAVLPSCTGEIASEGQTDVTNQMLGAGGRDIAEYWQPIDVALSQNTRMLSYSMLRTEVMRATGQSWVVTGVDQWERNRGPLGGADYKTTFADDLTPSQQRIVLIRKMSFQVCADLVAAEAGSTTGTVFTEIDPGAAFDATGATTKAQVAAMFKRFFLEEAAEADLADGLALLTKLAPTGADGRTAWRGLCAAYLSSMRFLTY